MNVSDLNAIADRADRDRSEIRTRTEGRIVGPDGKAYATGTTSCLVLKMEQ
jgi:hypothetical protein